MYVHGSRPGLVGTYIGDRYQPVRDAAFEAGPSLLDQVAALFDLLRGPR